MHVHELIELLKEYPNNMGVYLATTRHETAPIAEVRTEKTRGGEILLISSPGVWRALQTERC